MRKRRKRSRMVLRPQTAPALRDARSATQGQRQDFIQELLQDLDLREEIS